MVSGWRKRVKGVEINATKKNKKQKMVSVNPLGNNTILSWGNILLVYPISSIYAFMSFDWTTSAQYQSAACQVKRFFPAEKIPGYPQLLVTYLCQLPVGVTKIIKKLLE